MKRLSGEDGCCLGGFMALIGVPKKGQGIMGHVEKFGLSFLLLIYTNFMSTNIKGI